MAWRFPEPMTLDLRGDCAPDLAGGTFTFANPSPVPFADAPPNPEQRGWVGDITASQKVKVHDVPMAEVMRLYPLGEPAPWHWANALSLEWFSERNGRVVIQTAEFKLTLFTPAWTLTPDEDQASRAASASDYAEWIEKHCGPLTGEVQVVNLGELLAQQERDDDPAAPATSPNTRTNKSPRAKRHPSPATGACPKGRFKRRQAAQAVAA